MTTSASVSSKRPWPGPRPYEIREGSLFYGRDEEIDELRRMILRQQLTILSAESGAGKTSLLRAGLVYRLIKERMAQKDSVVKPILLFREWGGGVQGSVEDLFSYGLEEAIKNLAAAAPADFALLSSKTSRSNSFVQNVVGLSDVADGLIVIFDQFEEVLRAGEETAREAIKQIITLYRFEPRVRIVLSLRTEYHTYLRDLEAVISGLYTRTYFLKPMVALLVSDALGKSAQAANVEMDAEAIQKIVLMLVGASNKTDEATQTGTGLESIKDERVDLLTLQAILPELYDFGSHMSANADRVTISARTVEDYVGNRKPSELVGEALIRWIDNALLRPLDKSDHLTPEIIESLSADEKTGVVTRIASRMAQFLSSGGYKVSAEEGDLMYYTLRDDLTRLRPKFEETTTEDWKIASHKPVRVNRVSLGLDTGNAKEDTLNLSGIARDRKWSPAETADNLAGLFFETLFRLQVANILKPIHVRHVQVWELVHDGIGKPLSNWSEKRKDTWEDCAHSLTASKGADISIPKVPKKSEKVSDLCWNGCFVSPRGDPVLDGYEFMNCDLRGTIFQGCCFRGGKFNKCTMDGCLFLNCSFEAGSDGVPIIFDDCTSEGLTFIARPGLEPSEMGSMEFIHCDLSQVNFNSVKLAGSVTFGVNTTLSLCHFSHVEAKDLGTPAKIVFNGCKLFYSVWDKQSRRLLDFYDLTEETGNGLLDSHEAPVPESP